MFDHPNFRDYTFSEVPANRDLFLIDVKDMAEFEWEWLELYAGREGTPKVTWSSTPRCGPGSMKCSSYRGTQTSTRAFTK